MTAACLNELGGACLHKITQVLQLPVIAVIYKTKLMTFLSSEKSLSTLS